MTNAPPDVMRGDYQGAFADAHWQLIKKDLANMDFRTGQAVYYTGGDRTYLGKTGVIQRMGGEGETIVAIDGDDDDSIKALRPWQRPFLGGDWGKMPTRYQVCSTNVVIPSASGNGKALAGTLTLRRSITDAGGRGQASEGTFLFLRPLISKSVLKGLFGYYVKLSFKTGAA